MPDVKFAEAIHAWDGGENGPQEGYLTFSEGARIQIIEEHGADDWWHGKLNGVEGWFPASFVTTVPAADLTSIVVQSLRESYASPRQAQQSLTSLRGAGLGASQLLPTLESSAHQGGSGGDALPEAGKTPHLEA